MQYFLEHFDKKTQIRSSSSEVQQYSDAARFPPKGSARLSVRRAPAEAPAARGGAEEGRAFLCGVGDSIKVGYCLKGVGRIQFFTGIVTKVSGHKITLYSPASKKYSGIERIFSYQNPQIRSLNVWENPIEGAAPKRRSKSRKILWLRKGARSVKRTAAAVKTN